MSAQLTGSAREALLLMTDGSVMTVDHAGGLWIMGQPIRLDTFAALYTQRCIKLLDPTRKRSSRGNGYVLTERGRAVFNGAPLETLSSP